MYSSSLSSSGDFIVQVLTEISGSNFIPINADGYTLVHEIDEFNSGSESLKMSIDRYGTVFISGSLIELSYGGYFITSDGQLFKTVDGKYFLIN